MPARSKADAKGIDLSERRSRVPAWWADAKLGIFVHWGLFSVPGFAPIEGDMATLQARTDANPFARSPYSEWYQNSLRFPESAVSKHHHEHHADRPYDDFVDPFVAGLAQWDPERWARHFADTGAKYVVLVAKHHDGFCLWPSSVPNLNRSGWHTERDVVGELAAAVRAEGMRFGLYYSGGLDWTFDATPIGSFADLLTAVPDGAYPDYAEAQVRELIERYRPSVLWNDILWPTDHKRLMRLFRHYFEQVPDGVVNDRWLTTVKAMDVLTTKPGRKLLDFAAARAVRSGGLVPPKPRFFQFRTPEFATFPGIEHTPWECVRGTDHGFGFNRTSVESDFLSRNELLRTVVDIAAKGGNLLLNVGPNGDAQIPSEQLARLGWLAERAQAHVRSVAGTRPWVEPEARSVEGHEVRYTAHRDTVWAHLWREDDASAPATTVTVPFRAGPLTGVTDAAGSPLPFVAHERSLTVTLPEAVDPAVFSIAINRADAAG